MNKKVLEYGKLDKEAIDALKKEYGDVFSLAIPMNDEGSEVAYCYLKKPDRATLGASMAIEDRNPLKAKEIILRGAWISGYDKIIEDDDLFLSAITQVNNLITIRLAELKKN